MNSTFLHLISVVGLRIIVHTSSGTKAASSRTSNPDTVNPLRFCPLSADNIRMTEPFLKVMIRSEALLAAISGLLGPAALARSIKDFLD
jgi:hypothetical protein